MATPKTQVCHCCHSKVEVIDRYIDNGRTPNENMVELCSTCKRNDGDAGEYPN